MKNLIFPILELLRIFIYFKKITCAGDETVSSISEIKFNTYKVTLEAGGNKIQVGVLDCDTNDFITVFCQEFNFSSGCDINPKILYPGISFATSDRGCNFEIKNVSFVGTLAESGLP